MQRWALYRWTVSAPEDGPASITPDRHRPRLCVSSKIASKISLEFMLFTLIERGNECHLMFISEQRFKIDTYYWSLENINCTASLLPNRQMRYKLISCHEVAKTLKLEHIHFFQRNTNKTVEISSIHSHRHEGNDSWMFQYKIVIKQGWLMDGIYCVHRVYCGSLQKQ